MKRHGGEKMRENDALINCFTESYIEKLFYFCLRKTGNRQAAEDLSQDIALSVMTELRRGVNPDNFSAWVWQIARNRYSRWAEQKHMAAEALSFDDIGELELPSDESIEADFILSEDISRLRRELAFIASEYRNVIVAYYIESKSVGEIAKALSLPAGTVKAKLFRARNILKEGMNMAREFGTLAYKPENINFIQNGCSGSWGEPWSIVTHTFYKNILLAAYKTPSTAEALSLELGVALPYMESELDFLVHSTLMKKNGSKYETNIFIVSAEAQRKIHENLAKITPELTAAVIEAVEAKTEALNAGGEKWHDGYQSYEDMKWTLLMKCSDDVGWEVIKREHDGKDESCNNTTRPNGGAWDLLGLEEYNGKKPDFVGLHGGNFNSVSHFKFNYKGIRYKTVDVLEMDREELKLLDAFAKGEKVDGDTLEKLAEYGFVKKDGEEYVPTFAVFHKAFSECKAEKYKAALSKATDIAVGHYRFCQELIYKEIPAFLKKDRHQIQHAVSTIFHLRGAIIEEALRAGYICYGEGETEARDRMLGAFIEIE